MDGGPSYETVRTSPDPRMTLLSFYESAYRAGASRAAWDEKYGLLLSASPSMVGGNRGAWALRVPFEHLGARIDGLARSPRGDRFESSSLPPSLLGIAAASAAIAVCSARQSWTASRT